MSLPTQTYKARIEKSWLKYRAAYSAVKSDTEYKVKLYKDRADDPKTGEEKRLGYLKSIEISEKTLKGLAEAGQELRALAEEVLSVGETLESAVGAIGRFADDTRALSRSMQDKTTASDVYSARYWRNIMREESSRARFLLLNPAAQLAIYHGVIMRPDDEPAELEALTQEGRDVAALVELYKQIARARSVREGIDICIAWKQR